MAVRGLQERDLCPDAVEPPDAVHPAALDRPLSLQLESKFDEEPGCGREVVNHDADVLHPLDRHVLYGNDSRFEPQCQAPERTRSSREIFFESEERDINHTGAHATATPCAQPLHAEGPPTGAPSRSQILARTSSRAVKELLG